MEKNLTKNYIYNLIYRLLTIILPFITTPYISRVLNPDGIGIFNYTYAVACVFVLIASLGTSMYAQREIAFADNDVLKRSRVFWGIFVIRAIMSAVITPIYIFLMLYNKNYQIIYIAQYINILANVLDISWLFQGMEDFKRTATNNIFIKILSVVLIFCFVKNKEDLVIYTLISSGSALLSSLILWKFLRKLVCRVQLKREDITCHLKPVFLLFLPVAAIYVYTYIDKIILGLLSTEEQVGFYSQSENMVKLAMTIITSLGTVLLPRVSSLIHDKNWDEVHHQVLNSIKFVFFLGCPMVVGLIMIAPLFIPWYLGNAYLPCIFLMQLLSVLILIIGLSSVTGQAVLIPLNKQVIYTGSIMLGAAANLVINFILIPKYMAIGASIGTIIAELIVGAIQQTVVIRDVKIKVIDILLDNRKCFISTAVMGIVLYFIRPYFEATVVCTFIYLAIGICLYFTLMYLLKDRSVYGFLKSMIKK